MNWFWIGLAILLGAGIVAGAIMLRPGDFKQCVDIISSDIVRANITATLDHGMWKRKRGGNVRGSRAPGFQQSDPPTVSRLRPRL